MTVEEAWAAAGRVDIGGLEQSDVELAIRIRLVEEKFLELFAAGKMNGTVHTCVGQEWSAVAIAGRLSADDWITSNHRCHGHFIAKTGEWAALIDELEGLASGVCKGIGSSQHLYRPGFLSNGPQAALVPVATGIALRKRLSSQPGIVASFIGEGTLGEGALYEAMNLASLYNVPQLFICENNFYSQSTPQASGVAGRIADRPKAFGIEFFEGNTWQPAELIRTAEKAIAFVRSGRPAFLNVHTYRLNAHSKGDDDRAADEVSHFRGLDPLTILLKQPYWDGRAEEISREIEAHVSKRASTFLPVESYSRDQLPRRPEAKSQPVTNPTVRMVHALNEAYREKLVEGALFIGEDIADPYGGAFKVTKGLSTEFPSQVFSSPISEAGLVGIAVGASLNGRESFAEIMFGDFLTLAFDQIINNASKVFHMYGFQTSAPVRIRTPMGGKRGYGPTHSQSLEKFVAGIDNVAVISLTSLLDPRKPISELAELECPVILLENKVDYGRPLWQDTPYFELTRESKPFGSLTLRPRNTPPSLTVVSYGETARHLADQLERFFDETDEVPELVSLQLLHPLDLASTVASVRRTRSILVVEDGSVEFGLGAEILARLSEMKIEVTSALRIGAHPVPIPSARHLESALLPTIDRVLDVFKANRSGSAS